jgi:hypothetical protein
VNDWSAEELRRAAIEALGSHPDARALEALQRSDLSIAPAVGGWEASSGPVRAHRVTLSLDARLLGTMRASHAACDTLEAALARAVATRSGQALLGFELRWAPHVPPVVVGYRDAPPHAEPALAEAMPAYLLGLGEEALAHIVATAHVTQTARAVRLALDADGRARLVARSDGLALVCTAARDLLGDAAITVTVEP